MEATLLLNPTGDRSSTCRRPNLCARMPAAPRFRLLAAPLLFTSLIFAAGCGGSSAVTSPEATRRVARPAHVPQAARAGKPSGRALHRREAKLRREVKHWEGVPYRYGGEDRRGIDCSAFVRRLYDDVLDHWLPRSTAQQVQKGVDVGRNELQTGDLVFFRTSTKSRHVGIYLSEGEFAHASTSQGVTISHLDEAYWQRAYWTSRRLLDAAPAYADTRPPEPLPPAAHPSRSAPEQDEPDGDKRGW